ncbi:hypothetical protein FB451DRAFT_1285626 [Mycena latifolia]|nr:hypothetical protein FB451DRAFT_1285626 [Mycena latifolia]
MWALFDLPNRYSRDALQPPMLAQALCKRWANEWAKLGTGAFVLLCCFYTMLDRSRASYDLIGYTVVLLSMTCIFFGIAYAVILSVTFGKLDTNTAEGLDWIRKVLLRPPTNRFWNPWIMLSMPAVYIIWGVTLFILSFIWRTGDTHGNDEDSNPSLKEEYGPQIAATFMFVLGVIYLRLMIRDLRRMGSESGAQPTIPGTLLHEVSNVTLHDLVGRAGQIVLGHIFNISGGVGGTGGHTGGNSGGPQVEISPGGYFSNISGGVGGTGGSGRIGGSGGDGDGPQVETSPGGYFNNISGGNGGPGGAGNHDGGTGGTGGGTTIHVSP